jgi:hypothetical protein
MPLRRFWLFSLAALVLILPVAILQPFPSAETAETDSVAATYSHGTLSVTIPYHAPHAGAGQLSVEVLDPEDTVLGRVERTVTVSDDKSRWQEHIALAKPLSIEDLVWHRLRYRFRYAAAKDAIEGTYSISEILRQPVIHILGQQSYMSGAQAAVRVIVTDSKNEPIAGPGSVRIELTAAPAEPRVLFIGHLNQRGTTEAQFRLPAGLTGSYPLRYVAETSIGSTEYVQQVRLEDKASILLTTEKPIYQPGQTIHVRALALDRAGHEASARRPLTFEVEDSRGNKVFKKVTETDKFGIASAEFQLADEVNLGTYHLRALMGDANRAELALNVERYVLPKFKVAFDFGNTQTKHGYRPGDHVTGTVRANYFFGKPVDGAEVTIKASGMDVAQFDAGSAAGKTDADGAYRFDLRLPSYFAGRPLANGAARVLLEATVKDSAGHSETRGEPITVSESPLVITAVPESGALVPNLENQVFILTSYADGKPASTRIKVSAAGNSDQSAATDAGGVAVIRLKPAPGLDTLAIEAADNQGNRASASVRLTSRGGAEQILLRTERAVYHAGDFISLKVFSTRKRGTAYIDIVKDGQTVLTRDVDLANGQAELTLTATPELAGTVDANAYLFGSDAQPVGDHRLIFVEPADELKIEATADAAVYKPGDDAHVRFHVTNSRGEGVQAALGVQAVDEAVFALAEKQPGFAKVFFYLEQEAMKPRYEIHSIGMPEVVEPVPAAQAGQRDLAARALFSATELVNTNRFQTEAGREVPTTKYAEYAKLYRTRFDEQARQIVLRRYRHDSAEARDAWGTPIRVEPYGLQPSTYMVRSAGPDKQFETIDDFITYLHVRARTSVGRPRAGASAIDLTMERSRGAINGRAEITGTITDQDGGALEGTAVTVLDLSTMAVRTAKADSSGQFRFSALPPGEYTIRASSGNEAVTRNITVEPGDRAVLSVMLRSAPAEVVVVPVPLRIRVGGNVRQFMMGANGGMLGGVIGGIMPAPPPAAAAEAAFGTRFHAIYEKDAATLISVTPSAAPRVRSYFPEALYINPEIITDSNGMASISIPLADSITTWRMALMASTARGALGTGAASLKVFQDFFADLDLPFTLTHGDRVSIPVAVYNYSGAAGDVNLELQQNDWFSLVGDVPTKSLSVDSGRVGGSQFTLEAKRIGKFKLTLAARMAGGPRRADIVVREIEVVPNGREQSVVFNGRLENTVEHAVNFPPTAIPDAATILVRLYPGPLSQVIEGMDSLLRMPFGCFEQTSSATYPNVLALDYMKRTNKLTPEVHAKAEGFIANGYQRLLTFEVPGGGFSWFGNAPANKILTAYGLMEFYDMSQVHDVDAKVIQRTQAWLAEQQQPDGSWKPDTSFINEGATNRYNTDAERITAYLAWALESTGYRGPAVEKARQYVVDHLNGKADAYTLAVLANFAADYAKDRDFTGRAMEALLDARTEKGDQAWWTAEETGVYGGGPSAAIETTGLAVQALLKWGEASATAEKALRYIASKKDAAGAWGTTQATIMALRALLLSTGKGAADVRGTVELALDGRTVEHLALTPDNNDLLHQFVFNAIDAKAAHAVQLRFTGKGGLAYQVVGRYFVPWTEKSPAEPLLIDVAYDRTHLAQDDLATATATVRNNLGKPANMVMVDLGIPPGFDLLSEDLQDYIEKSAARASGRLEKFNLTATQAILYFDSIAAGDTVKLQFRLRAKYPIRARTFASRVYEYYSPEVSALARPVELEVRKR